VGVVYKFKPEVVNFIIQQKKNEFSLSCRKLAERVTNQFQIKASKSAINNILKQASLNSPPKRPASTYGLCKKFQIPEEKKKQLLEVVQKSLEESLSSPAVVKKKSSVEVTGEKEKFSPIFLKLAAVEVFMEEYSGLLESSAEWEQGDENCQRLLEEYGSKESQAFLEVSHFVVQFEGGKQLTFDANFSTVWNVSVPSFLHGPFYKAIENLSSQLISNKMPTCFNSLPEECLVDLIASFEVVGKNIEKVSVFSDDNLLLEFSSIPVKKRSFLVGIWKEQKEFSEWTNNVHSEKKESFYHSVLKKGYCFYEGIDGVGGDDGVELRVFVLWEYEEKEPFLIVLTNQFHKSAEDVIFEYLIRCPSFLSDTEFQNLNFSPEEFSALSDQGDLECSNENNADTNGLTSFEEISENFKNHLYRHCLKYFFGKDLKGFSKEGLDRLFFGIPFKYLKNNEAVLVILEPPEDKPPKKKARK